VLGFAEYSEEMVYTDSQITDNQCAKVPIDKTEKIGKLGSYS
jgi:hypothetical protein